jgi:hypothetical protein
MSTPLFHGKLPHKDVDEAKRFTGSRIEFFHFVIRGPENLGAANADDEHPSKYVYG